MMCSKIQEPDSVRIDRNYGRKVPEWESWSATGNTASFGHPIPGFGFVDRKQGHVAKIKATANFVKTLLNFTKLVRQISTWPHSGDDVSQFLCPEA